MNQLEFESHLMRGSLVIVRWTNCGNQWQAPGWVSKLNRRSLRVTLSEAIEGHYPTGQEIIIPRSLAKEWSTSNCVLPND